VPRGLEIKIAEKLKSLQDLNRQAHAQAHAKDALRSHVKDAFTPTQEP
jgi:hypothetical protein